MKKKTMLAVMAAALLLTACSINPSSVRFSGGGKVKSEARSLKGFERIEIMGSPTVYYTQADSFSVTVKGPGMAIENILTEVRGGTLVVKNRGKLGVVNVQVFSDDSQVYVSSPDLVGISLNGSGDFISDGRIDTDRLNIMMRGSGDIQCSDVICDECDITLVGSGDITMDRLEARQSTASLVGSGDIKLRQWQVLTTSLFLKGSGDIDVAFMEGCQSVSCDLMGSGDIDLSGKVKHMDKHKSGSGEIDTDKLLIE